MDKESEASIEAVVEARGLCKRFYQGSRPLDVLRALNLTVLPGEFVAVLGPSGSGKSTLLNILGLMDQPTTGTLKIAGQKTRGLNEAARARLRNRSIGSIFQFDSLLSEFTVIENVLMPARILGEPEEGLAMVQEQALELLEMLGIRKLAKRFPTRLSGGERQRAALARALVNRPAVLLADEPTGNLDRTNAELVFNYLKNLAKTLEVAVVMVTHNEHAADFATRAIHLLDGQIAETAENNAE